MTTSVHVVGAAHARYAECGCSYPAMIWQQLESKLAALDSEQLRRRRRIVDSPSGTRMSCADGREFARLFAAMTISVLLMIRDWLLQCAMARRQWGVGSGAAHPVSGHLRPHQQLEESLAAFVGLPRALLFSTGFMANRGIRAGPRRARRRRVCRSSQSRFLDRCRTGFWGAEHKRYAHNDVDALRALLEKSTASRHKLIPDRCGVQHGWRWSCALARAVRTGGSPRCLAGDRRCPRLWCAWRTGAEWQSFAFQIAHPRSALSIWARWARRPASPALLSQVMRP